MHRSVRERRLEAGRWRNLVRNDGWKLFRFDFLVPFQPALLTSIDLFLFERPSRGVNYLTEYRSRDLRFRIDDARWISFEPSRLDRSKFYLNYYRYTFVYSIVHVNFKSKNYSLIITLLRISLRSNQEYFPIIVSSFYPLLLSFFRFSIFRLLLLFVRTKSWKLNFNRARS